MRRFRTTIVLFLATLLFISVCAAQQTPTTSVPNLIRYSGNLKDAQGAALSSSTAVGVTFAIYKQQDGGAPVWQETQNVTPDASGQYSVVLGSTTATGLPDDLFSQQEQRWLGVQVQGQAEQARVLLVSVPYAFKAHEAETLGGLPASAFVKAPPTDASGTSTETGTAVNATGIAVSTKNKAATDTSGVLPLGMLSLNGIDFWGDTLPGTVRHDYTATTETNGAVSNKIFIGGDNTNSTFPPIPFSTIQVGIGTKNLGISKVQIFDPVFPTLGISGGTIPANSGGVELTVATSPGFFSNFAAAGDAVLRVPGTTGAARNDLILTDRGAGGIRFGTGQACGGGPPCETEKMTLLHNGNLGIGSNNPPTTFGVGDFLNPVDRTNPPFQMDKFGDMVRIRNVGTYHWPTALGTGAGPFVLTDMVGNGTLQWLPGGGGNVVGPPSHCMANYLTKWTGGLNVGCSFVWENPAGVNPYFVGIGPHFQLGSPVATRQLQVDGDIDVLLADGTQHYQITEQTVLSIDGIENTFVGVGAGFSNAFNGRDNTFTGLNAGVANFAGNYNSYYGSGAGGANVSGQENTCVGKAACEHSTGSNNTILGAGAGLGNFTGSNNTFVGWSAGTGTTNGDNNIYVGSGAGAGSENNTIRIGTIQTATYVAGIVPLPTGLTTFTVCVDPTTGQLYRAAAFTNCMPSSRRFKEQITDMGDRSSKLLQLRPVNYFYKSQYDDGSHLLQYGLIAEEVAKVYPEMVAYEKDGQPYTVKYQLLAPMLLNELQKQHKVVAAQQDVIQTQQQQIESLQKQNAEFQQRLSGLESLIARK